MSMTYADRFYDSIKEEAFDCATDDNGLLNQNAFDCRIVELTDKKLNELNHKVEMLEEAFDVNARVYDNLLKDYHKLKLKCGKYRNQTL